MAPRKTDSTSWKRGARESLWTIRKLDSEPILRYDLQYQVLHDIFADRTFRFTAPVDRHNPPAQPIYLNFDQLYLESILSSMKTTQNLRTKLIDNPTFATNFSKLCFLINIGRINTTLAFYPSMKTALRTYHPVPSLQTDEMSRNQMQDAPRLKSLLKACYLDWEVPPGTQPSSLYKIAQKSASPDLVHGPPTTVINALFQLFNEAIWVADKYFPPSYDLLDLFYPSESPSAPRAKSFLSLIHHVLEDKSFIHDFSAPPTQVVRLSPPIEMSREPAEVAENVDTEQELAFIAEMKEVREGVVKLVPAIQKREEEMRAAMQKRAEKDAEDAAGGGGAKEDGSGGQTKRRRERGGGKGKSWARVERDRIGAEKGPIDILPEGWMEQDWSSDWASDKSSLPGIWAKVRRDLVENRDPDYDSEEDEAWEFDLLLRRRLLTFRNPSTGIRGPVKDLPEFEEWKRRREAGDGLAGDENEDDEPADEMMDAVGEDEE